MDRFLAGKKISILLAVGTPEQSREMTEWFTQLGYVVDTAANGLEAWQKACMRAYDALILDVMLAGMDGLTVCRRLREEMGLSTPVIMMTSDEALENRILCLNWGADDFVTRPFAMLELEARIRSAVRRSRMAVASRKLSWAGIDIDMQVHEARCDGKPMKLRPTSFLLLARLVRSAPALVTREELEHELYGGTRPESDSLRTHIYQLRLALAKAGRPILTTVTHVGFRLEPWPAEKKD